MSNAYEELYNKIKTLNKQWFYDKTEITSLINGKANVNHAHTDKEDAIEFITGTTTSTGNILGGTSTKLNSLQNGTKILYKTPAQSSTDINTAYLQLTLANGTTSNNYLCDATGGFLMTKEIPANTVLLLVYVTSFQSRWQIISRSNDATTNSSGLMSKTDKTKLDGLSNFSGSYNDLTDKPTIPSASSTTPSADTTSGSYGSGTSYARSNHTHPKSSLYAEASHTHSQYLTSHQSLKTINNETLVGTGNITIDVDEETEYIELSVDEEVSEYAYGNTIELYGTSTKDIIDNTTTNAKFLFKMPSIFDDLGSSNIYIRLHYNNGNSYRTGVINNGNSVYRFDDAEKLSNAYVLVLLSEYNNSFMFFDIISKSNYAEASHIHSLDTLRFGNDFDNGWESIPLFTQNNDNKSVDMGGIITLDYSNNESKATYNRNLEDYSKDYYEIATINDIDYTIRGNIGEYVSAVALSNDYDDLDNKPTIPTATSDLANDGDGVGPFLTGDDLTNYLHKNDVKDNLTSTDTNKPLSAKQGKELKSLVDGKQDIIKSITVTNDGRLYLLTQVPRYITYSTTKSMLTYENDYADISITVTDENQEIIEGAEVQFYITFATGSSSPTRYLYTDNTGTCTTRVFSEELSTSNQINIKYGEYTSRYNIGRQPNLELIEPPL